MTYKQALKRFRQEVMPGIPSRDKPACREAWNNWTDGLHKDGEITARQYDTWIGPESCTVARRRRR